ncbi:MAG: alpha-mannosidase, partial [Catenulispora sp.]
GSRPLLAVRALGPYGDGPIARSLLTVEDPRVRVVGLTVPRPDTILIRLQSFAEEPVRCSLRIGFPVTEARLATYLGSPGDSLPGRSGGAVPVEIPALSTQAVLLECGHPS